VDRERLHVEQVATTCWEVQRGSVRLSSALTRAAAEAERELVERLHDRQERRADPAGKPSSNSR
jgi:hypothetical protein